MQAAEIFGISDRSKRRWRVRLEQEGYDGLYDRRMRRPSPKRVPLPTVEKVLRLYRQTYYDREPRLSRTSEPSLIIWSNQQERIVDNDNTVRYDKLILQIAPQKFRFSLARCRVLVCRHLDESISLHCGAHLLGRYDAHGDLQPDDAEAFKSGGSPPRTASTA
jgi:hypothetical protein